MDNISQTYRLGPRRGTSRTPNWAQGCRAGKSVSNSCVCKKNCVIFLSNFFYRSLSWCLQLHKTPVTPLHQKQCIYKFSILASMQEFLGAAKIYPTLFQNNSSTWPKFFLLSRIWIFYIMIFNFGQCAIDKFY